VKPPGVQQAACHRSRPECPTAYGIDDSTLYVALRFLHRKEDEDGLEEATHVLNALLISYIAG
jgi:hypothetical protein